jgi:hypothetical protein
MLRGDAEQPTITQSPAAAASSTPSDIPKGKPVIVNKASAAPICVETDDSMSRTKGQADKRKFYVFNLHRVGNRLVSMGITKTAPGSIPPRASDDHPSRSSSLITTDGYNAFPVETGIVYGTRKEIDAYLQNLFEPFFHFANDDVLVDSVYLEEVLGRSYGTTRADLLSAVIHCKRNG